jgi:homoserine O-acetyltransferase/O-succinyltransferase
MKKPDESQTNPGFSADDPAGADAGDAGDCGHASGEHAGGESLASLKLHCLTFGTPRRDASGSITNGVLLLHGTPGSAADLTQAEFFDALYGPGKPLDLNRYFLAIPDAIGAGGSSKPSDGLHAHFPHYGYKEQVRADHQMLEQIGIKHLRLVLGTSEACRPDFGVRCSRTTWIASRRSPVRLPRLAENMIWREMVSQAIR